MAIPCARNCQCPHLLPATVAQKVSRRKTYHSVVLELRLAERRSVAGDDDKLGLAVAEALQGALVSKSDLSGLHHKREARVDGVGIALSFLGALKILAASLELPRWPAQSLDSLSRKKRAQLVSTTVVDHRVRKGYSYAIVACLGSLCEVFLKGVAAPAEFEKVRVVERKMLW